MQMWSYTLSKFLCSHFLLTAESNNDNSKLSTSAIDMMTRVVAEKLYSTPGKCIASTYYTVAIYSILKNYLYLYVLVLYK